MTDFRIKYFGYNGFIIESGGCKIAIDPGTSLYLLGLGPVIPRSEWSGVTHIFVTHGDPDHYWNADRLAKDSGAPLVCGAELVRLGDEETFIAHPRSKKLEYTVPVDTVYSVGPDTDVDVEGVRVRTIPARHGDLRLSFLFGLVKKTVVREPDSLFAKGETGFVLTVNGCRFANLGDTELLPDWKGLAPDVLMIPIGGGKIGNTMDERAALEAVESIKPKVVIPCHYDCGIGFQKRGNPADAVAFKRAVEERGVRCDVMKPGEDLVLSDLELGLHPRAQATVA